jgi:uncharacterized protein YoxC
MKKFLIIIGIIVLCVLIFLISTKIISLKPARESVEETIDKVFEPIERPIKQKQTTEEKLKAVEKELQEKHDKLLEDTGRYK